MKTKKEDIKGKEKFFWADQIAEQIVKRNKNKKTYVCAAGITPSGTIHIGNFREVITTELVVRALKDIKKNVKYVYSWDDFDRFRKVPENIPENKKKEYENYMGMPVSDVKNPFGDKSYAEYFEKIFENELKDVGIKPKFIRQSIMYKQKKYASLIKLAIEKKDGIKKILDKYRKDPLEKNWFPITVYCEKCKKDFTKVLNVNNYEVEYECKCGFRNKIDYRKKGIVKLSWRVDWPMRWKYEKVDYEPGGIDHSAPGGSYTTAKEISKEIFNYEPPIYTFYDWIRVKGGTEFSSSSGNVISLKEGLEIYEPEVLRYLFVGTRPNKGFQISFDNDVIKIYEDFDELERKYYEKLANPQEKRFYELSVLKLRKTRPKKTSFRHLITLVQIGKTNDLNKEDKVRVLKVRSWLEKYAEDDFKFEVQEKIHEDVSLSDKQKQALKILKETLKMKKGLTEDKLFNEFYNICNSVEIKNTEFFTGAYNVLINRNKGPRLASLILEIGKEKVIKLLNHIK